MKLRGSGRSPAGDGLAGRASPSAPSLRNGNRPLFSELFPTYWQGHRALVGASARNLARAAVRTPRQAPSLARRLASNLYSLGAGLVGFAELLGFKYRVQPYQSEVSSTLSRGSRLEDADMADLHARGFKSVINLCAENDADTPRAEALGMKSLHLEVMDNLAPSASQMRRFLDFVTQPEHQPAYVHCQKGRGRTGVAVATYRMAVEGWSPEEAIAEYRTAGAKLPSQLRFLELFGDALAAGQIPGYPLEK